MENTKSPRITILDPMRFMAAIAVVVYHYSIYFDHDSSSWVSRAASFGYLGVPFFFILSGFVITASARGRSALEFAFSRAARLYPAFWACLIVSALVVALFGGGVSLKQISLNATILNDYFGVENFDDVYWTLQAEIKFYGCVFLLLLTGLFKYVRTWVSIWLMLSVTFHYFEQPFFMGWFINPSYSFFFIGGVCAYLLYENRKSYYVMLLMTTALLFSVVKAGEQISSFFPSAGDVDRRIAGAIILTFFVFFYMLSRGWFAIRSSKLLMLLGAISYPLYLIHNVAGKTLIESISKDVTTYLAVGLVFTLAILISAIIHIYFERPISFRFNAFGKDLSGKIQAYTHRPEK